MDVPDIVNGSFEMLGTVAVLAHFRRTLQDKMVAGASPWAALFFTSWGFWNLYYYPHLGQWWSFVGGASLALVNCLWVSAMIYYTRYPGGKKDVG